MRVRAQPAKVVDVSAEDTLADASHATAAAADGAVGGDGEDTTEKASVEPPRGAVNEQLVGPLPVDEHKNGAFFA